MQDLGTLGGTTSYAYGINDSGAVVGYAFKAGNVQHAFLYTSGAMLDLNTLLPTGSGWSVLTTARAINDHGQIVGTGTYNGQTMAFLMEIPEPSSALLLLGLTGTASMLRRRSRQDRGATQT